MRRAGLATHYVPSKLLPQLQQSLLGLGPAAEDHGARHAPSRTRMHAGCTHPGLPWLLACPYGWLVHPLQSCVQLAAAGTVGELLASFEGREQMPEGQLEGMRCVPGCQAATHACLPVPAAARFSQPWIRCIDAALTCAAPRLQTCSADISVCFGGRRSVEDVYAACEELGGQWGIDTIGLMSK